MKTTTLQLLPTTSYGSPSGNYDGSSLAFNGEDQQAANYYGGLGNLQTVAFFLTAFNGLIKIEASLDADPTSDEQWFKIYEFDGTGTATTSNFSTNITGNFTWIRARVEDFVGGTINKVILSY